MQKLEPILKMVEISKNFINVQANKKINFNLYHNEICALLGENGAGKSTLMKILYGLYRMDEGKIFIEGEEVQIFSPNDALRLGIGMVHQNFNLVLPHKVWENIALDQHGVIPKKVHICREISRISDEFGLEVNPENYVWQLSVGEKQRVEIIKSLYKGVHILILDEPTAVLTPHETESLFAMLKNMVKKGMSIILISHKLKEIMDISDRVVVLRAGSVVGEIKTCKTSPTYLASLMVGGEKITTNINKKRTYRKREILKVEKITVRGDMGNQALKEVSFDLHEGEILGFAGVSGNGQRELFEILTGMRKSWQGKIYFDEKLYTKFSPPDLVRLGWARIPEDRMVNGVILTLSLKDNFLLEVYKLSKFHKWFMMNSFEIKKYAESLVSKYDIRPPLIDSPVQKLSGGNLQKVIVARELSLKPRMILASQPSRGLDVKAVSYIQEVLLAEKEKGTAILLISEDLDEIMDLSDRIAVIYKGEIINIVERNNVNRTQIGLMMAGLHGL